MKEKISRISMIVYLVLLILSFVLEAIPGNWVVWFCVMAFLAVPPIVAGPKRYRIIGIVALIIAIAAAVSDYRAGKNMQERMEQILRRYGKQAALRSPASTLEALRRTPYGGVTGELPEFMR
jgi:membrane protein implicated in regulation of membrane protease activity